MAERNVLKYSHPVSEFWKNAASNLDGGTSIRRMSKDKIIDSITAECEERSSASVVRPWNYVDFLWRLRTFRPFNWFAKPKLISPLRCARLGWYNKANNTLCCGSCGIELKHDPDDASGTQLYHSMMTSHNKHICGWVEDEESGTCNFSPESFLHLPPVPGGMGGYLDAFGDRLRTWLRVWKTQQETFVAISIIPDELKKWEPVWNILRIILEPSALRESSSAQGSASSTDVGAVVKSHLYSLLRGDSGSPDRGFSRSQLSTSVEALPPAVILLSLFGWEYSTEGHRAECPICGRHFAAVSASTPGDNDENSCKVDVFQEHRYFCPWVAPFQRFPEWDDRTDENIAICSESHDGASTAIKNSSLSAASNTAVDVESLSGWCVVIEALLGCCLDPEDMDDIMSSCKHQRADAVSSPADAKKSGKCEKELSNHSVGDDTVTINNKKRKSVDDASSSEETVDTGAPSSSKVSEERASSDIATVLFTTTTSEDDNNDDAVVKTSNKKKGSPKDKEGAGRIVYKKIKQVLDLIESR